jgi:hypothetical protein
MDVEGDEERHGEHVKERAIGTVKKPRDDEDR